MSQSKVKNESGTKATWKPPHPAEHGQLDAAQVNHLSETAFAFPRLRKEPMTDASHVRNAIARFDQVKGPAMKNAIWRSPTSRQLPNISVSE